MITDDVTHYATLYIDKVCEHYSGLYIIVADTVVSMCSDTMVLCNTVMMLYSEFNWKRYIRDMLDNSLQTDRIMIKNFELVADPQFATYHHSVGDDSG